ncbi:hypothetical protein BaRGS_00024358, partial [Batillaria attramentaria]
MVGEQHQQHPLTIFYRSGTQARATRPMGGRWKLWVIAVITSRLLIQVDGQTDQGGTVGVLQVRQGCVQGFRTGNDFAGGCGTLFLV